MAAGRRTLRILVVARYNDLCDEVVEELKDGGEDACCASSTDDAVGRLRAELFHVAVIEEVPPQLATNFRPVCVEATRRGLPWVAMVSTRVPDGAAAVLRMPFSTAQLLNAVRSVVQLRLVR